jgi:hypothetical protein
MKDQVITFTTVDNDNYSVRLEDIAALRRHIQTSNPTLYHIILKGVLNFVEISEDTYNTLQNVIKHAVKHNC